MLQQQHRTANGLIAGPNPISAGEGSLLQAENCVIDREGVTEKRRGFTRYAVTTDDTILTEFQDRLVAWDGVTLKVDNGSGTLTSLTGTFLPPGAFRPRFLEDSRVLFFTTSRGPYKLDSLTGTPARAGMPAGLDTTLATNTGTWFLSNTQTGYRHTWSRTDATDRLIEGAPSWQRKIVNATGGAFSTTVTVTVPDDVAAGDLLNLYRTPLSADATASPGDDHFLVQSVTVTAGHLSAKTITIQDTTPDAFLDTPLYTNAEQDTISGANLRPPWCVDMCHYRGYTFYLNTKREQEKDLMLKSISGITDGADSITVTEGAVVLTFIFGAAEDIPNRTFQRVTALTDAENIRETAENFCRVFNRHTGNTTHYAYYESGEDDAPGKLKIKARTLGRSSFSLTATAGCGGNFSPTLPTSGTATESSDGYKSSRMCWGKFEQPEAVPAVNFNVVGRDAASGAALLRGVALQTAVILLKEDGVWRQIGDTEADFDVRPLDPAVPIVCPDTATIVDNNVYTCSLQGLVKISENGVGIISWPIEREFKKTFAFTDYKTLSFAVGYQSDRRYLVFTQEVSADTQCKIAWCFNHLTGKWTTIRKTANHGVVLTRDDRLYLATPGWILQERKSYNTSMSDYQDEALPCTIASVGTSIDSSGSLVSTATVTYTEAERLTEGFRLYQAATSMASNVVTVDDLSATSFLLTLEEHLPILATGAATLSIPVEMIVRWKPEACGNAALQKHFATSQIYLEDDSAMRHELSYWVDRHDVGFHTDINTDVTWYKHTTPLSDGLGMKPFGLAAWGDMDPPSSPIVRQDIPTQFTRAVALSLWYRNRHCLESPKILNMALSFRATTEITAQGPR